MVTRVLVVDDSRIARGVLEDAVHRAEGFVLARSLESAENAKIYCMNGFVDLVLMDIYTLGGESGLAAAAQIKRKCPRIKVIVVTSLPEESFLRRAKESGCDSFWYKDESEQDLVDVMKRTVAGESVYPDAAPVVTIGLAKSTEFTRKEIEVMHYITKYKNYNELAMQLGITERTVRFHIANILDKTGFQTFVQLAFEVAQKGFIVSFKDEI